MKPHRCVECGGLGYHYTGCPETPDQDEEPNELEHAFETGFFSRPLSPMENYLQNKVEL